MSPRKVYLEKISIVDCENYLLCFHYGVRENRCIQIYIFISRIAREKFM